MKVFRYVKMSSVRQYKTHTGNSGNKIHNLEITKIASYKKIAYCNPVIPTDF